jgi:RHS repeat-associated protein
MMDGNGLVYLRARYYDSELGVFTALDPVEGSAQRARSLNRYGYVAGNPANLTDPSGMIAETPGMWDSCARQENNCVYQCLLANSEWLQIAGEAEVSRVRPEDISSETIAAFYLSYHRFQECISQNCSVTYIGTVPFLATPWVDFWYYNDYDALFVDFGAFKGTPGHNNP